MSETVTSDMMKEMYVAWNADELESSKVVRWKAEVLDIQYSKKRNVITTSLLHYVVRHGFQSTTSRIQFVPVREELRFLETPRATQESGYLLHHENTQIRKNRTQRR